MKSIIQKLGYVPEHIMINVPIAFFCEESERRSAEKMQSFQRYYEMMGKGIFENDCFYHFISRVPTLDTITHVYVCFDGFVQYKAILVQFLKNQPVMLHDYRHPEPRDWCITTGPIVKPPFEIKQQGFQGFRYCKELF